MANLEGIVKNIYPNTVMRITVITACLIALMHSFGTTAVSQQKLSSTPHTCWGWIKGHTEIDGGRVKRIRGRVVDPAGEPVIGALVEIFAYNNEDLDKRTRVAFHIVGDEGRFQFTGLRAGKYELRGSYCRGSGFDAGHTIVVLSPRRKDAFSKESVVTLNISQ